MDTIREFADLAEAELNLIEHASDYGRAVVTFSVSGRGVARKDLDALAVVDRNRLEVDVRREMIAWVRARFGRTEDPAVWVDLDVAPQSADALRRKLQRKLQDGNWPVMRPRRVLPALPVVGMVALVALWIWVLRTVEVAPAPAALGWFSVVVACAGGCLLVGYLRRRMYLPFVGNRVLGETREKTIARRADRRANLRLAAITIPAGLVVGVLLAWFTDLFGLK